MNPSSSGSTNMVVEAIDRRASKLNSRYYNDRTLEQVEYPLEAKSYAKGANNHSVDMSETRNQSSQVSQLKEKNNFRKVGNGLVEQENEFYRSYYMKKALNSVMGNKVEAKKRQFDKSDISEPHMMSMSGSSSCATADSSNKYRDFVNPFPIPYHRLGDNKGYQNDSNASSETVIEGVDAAKRIDEITRLYSEMQMNVPENHRKIAEICKSVADRKQEKQNEKFHLNSTFIPSYKIDLDKVDSMRQYHEGGAPHHNLATTGAASTSGAYSNAKQREMEDGTQETSISRPIYNDYSSIPILSKRVSVDKVNLSNQGSRSGGVDLLDFSSSYDSYRMDILGGNGKHGNSLLEGKGKRGETLASQLEQSSIALDGSLSSDSAASVLSSPELSSLSSTQSSPGRDSEDSTRYVKVSEKVVLVNLSGNFSSLGYSQPSIINISDFNKK
ncbi:hypothetical protein AYI70_g7077 [Smittium culicis]|uniref:Uncharacterized protein n=1 Tax=Smittium culicis TaxID=133412 RepID=A0A1R1X7I3_9FUNG|nr:hypothetical protein AYI70_g10248 [Smittium culicis]OMJ15714.1 hypothetical protein AYI70_g7077 [Smittium culicis]